MTVAARTGHARINGITVKAVSQVKVGDKVRLRINGFDCMLEVFGLLSKRVDAPEAVKAYWDITPL